MDGLGTRIKVFFTFLRTHKLNRYWWGYFYIHFIYCEDIDKKVARLMWHRLCELKGI